MGRVKGTFSSQNDQFFVHHSDISFLSLFVTTFLTFFILGILDIGELTYKRWRTETSAKRPVTH